jgi:GDPmannose 4,6-dehydratase
MPTALITGVSGQDGSYLSEFLVAKDYRVVGLTRNARRALGSGYARAFAGIELVEGSFESTPSLFQDLIKREKPDEVYHLGGPTRVSTSWQKPVETQIDIALSTAMLVTAAVEELPSPRVFFAGSSEIFAAEDHPQNEGSPRDPPSPYGKAKLEAMEFVERARRDYGLYGVTGILYNHESPRRGADFVSQKIVKAAVRIARGSKESLQLGAIDVRRDWGFAGDYVRAMWLMMFQDDPEDLVIGSGVDHSVADMCDAAFACVGLNWKDHVESDPSLLRPSDPPFRVADPSRAKSRLGWTPEVDFERLIAMMVEHEKGQLSADG